MAGLYVHIPFCKQACYYCDFHFSTNQHNRAQIVHAICREIKLQKNYLKDEDIQTIYLGGGTPSLLTKQELNAIFQAIHCTFPVSPSAEITLEANPDDLTKEKLNELKVAGINRLSIGIQSFDDAILKYLNRAHDAGMARSCVEDAYDTGFQNISVDLIYAIPDLDDGLWRKNINEVQLIKPQHISAYALTIEKKTVFGRRATHGQLKIVEDDHAAIQLQMLVESLGRENYEQYEVSNFAQPGFYSRHNSSYWKDNNYLGVGPSAHSYNGITRQYNISNNSEYLKKINQDEIPATLEVLTREDKINEYLLTRLRTSWGVDLNKLKNKFMFDLAQTHRPYIDILLENKLAIISENTLLLTASGKLLADKIASDLFLPVKQD